MVAPDEDDVLVLLDVELVVLEALVLLDVELVVEPLLDVLPVELEVVVPELELEVPPVPELDEPLLEVLSVVCPPLPLPPLPLVLLHAPVSAAPTRHEIEIHIAFFISGSFPKFPRRC